MIERVEAEAAGGDSGRLSALRRCVADPEAFLAEHWGRRPVLTPGRQLSAGFTDLLDVSAVDELVSRRGLRTPFLRMARDGSVIASSKFTRGGGAGAATSDQVADDLVLGQVGDGATLVLQALHRTWPPLVTFASQLAAELGHPVQVNAYITPPQNQGFAAHYDVHDVFVLQVAGRKSWQVHEPVLDAPLASQPWDQRKPEVSSRAAEPPLLDTVLEPGDALYLPRGYLHSATALGEFSIHLTVGMHPRTRYHLVEHLLRSAAEDVALRTSLPAGVDLSDPAVLDVHLRATVDALHRYLDRVPPDKMARLVGEDLMDATRPEPLAPVGQLVAAENVQATTLVRLRPALRYRLWAEDGQLRLHVLSKTMTLPLSCEPALKVILGGDPISPAELPELDADEQLVLVRRLLRDGIVVPVVR